MEIILGLLIGVVLGFIIGVYSGVEHCKKEILKGYLKASEQLKTVPQQETVRIITHTMN
jgi:ABC-type nitrate/sulfonate/bicarbonate transport system permease component